MHARPTGDNVFYCEACEEWRSEDAYSQQEYAAHSENDYYGVYEGEMLFSDDCYEVTIYTCDRCEEKMEEPETVMEWRCGACDASFGGVNPAKECCT